MSQPKTQAQKAIDGFESSRLGYGDMINHSDILGWADIEYPDMSGMSIEDQKQAINDYSLARLTAVEALRKYLLTERQMYIASVHGSGYRIVKPSEQTERAVKDGMQKVRSGLKQAEKGITNINTALLDASERQFNTTTRTKFAALEHLIGKKKDYLTLK